MGLLLVGHKRSFSMNEVAVRGRLSYFPNPVGFQVEGAHLSVVRLPTLVLPPAPPGKVPAVWHCCSRQGNFRALAKEVGELSPQLGGYLSEIERPTAHISE